MDLDTAVNGLAHELWAIAQSPAPTEDVVPLLMVELHAFARTVVIATLREKSAEIERLRTALEQCDHQTHALRVWNGQQWTYHPPQAGRIAEICKARMELAPNVEVSRRPGATDL